MALLDWAGSLMAITVVLAVIAQITGWMPRMALLRIVAGSIAILQLTCLVTSLRNGWFARPFCPADRISPRAERPALFWLTVALAVAVLSGAALFSIAPGLLSDHGNLKAR
jgi:hypothetical protein